MDVDVTRVRGNGIDINVATAGSGPAILLLHGFPHTWRLWSAVLPELARTRRVIAPDLRGLGDSTRAQGGYDAVNLAEDAAALLDALGVAQADVVGIDAGTPPALLLALRAPQRVRRLVLMEALLGTLPGGEAFTAAGPPWWFGFHAVPGFAEQVLQGHEGDYLDFFYRTGTHDGAGLNPSVRDAFVASYTGRESLRCAFEHYRAMPQTAMQIAEAARTSRLTVPTLAVGARPVGDVLHRQLQPISDDLTGRLLPDCGHIIPLDRPEALLEALAEHLG